MGRQGKEKAQMQAQEEAPPGYYTPIEMAVVEAIVVLGSVGMVCATALLAAWIGG